MLSDHRTLRKVLALTAVLGFLGAFTFYRYNYPVCDKICKRAVKRALQYLREDKHSQLLQDPPQELIGEQVTLRKFSWSDFGAYKKLLKNRKVTDLFFITPSEPPNEEIDTNSYLYAQLIDQYFGNRLIYSVLDSRTGAIGGMIEFVRSERAKLGNLAGWASPEYWGSGTATETVSLALQAFFSLTNQEEVSAYVDPRNKRCTAFLTKYGFRLSGQGTDSHADGYLIFNLEKERYSYLAQNCQKGDSQVS